MMVSIVLIQIISVLSGNLLLKVEVMKSSGKGSGLKLHNKKKTRYSSKTNHTVSYHIKCAKNGRFGAANLGFCVK